MNEQTLNLPADLAADVETYAGETARFLGGALPGPVFKAKRVPRGVYEQRRDGTYMVRVRVAGGVLTAGQMRLLAELGTAFGDGRLHVTTRQDMQLHDVAIGDTPEVMRRLLAGGMTAKGGGGNTVRNVTACPYAGVCPGERFDVTPFARAVTENLIPLTGSYNLPRKYKIAFSGCAADCALAQVSDLGLVADWRAGEPGFAVYAGGGLGGQSRVADRLTDWLPARDALRAAEAMRRLFDRHGDRANKHRARLRFVFERLGVERMRAELAAEMDKLAAEKWPLWQGTVDGGPASGAGFRGPPEPRPIGGVAAVAQRQAGYVAVPLHVPLGFMTAADLTRLADLADRFSGERGVRTTRRQNLVLRFVKEGDLPALTAEVAALSVDVLKPDPLERIVACAGSSTCRLGLCLARGAASAGAEALARSGVDSAVWQALEIHINGCPNACGQQPVAPIGFSGAAQRTGGRLMPAYRVTVGGGCGAAGARLGAAAGQIPARALPAFLVDLAADYAGKRTAGERFETYVERVGPAYFETLAQRHAAVPAYEEKPEYYRDFGATEDFSLAGRGAGECGSGVFEVIQKDIEEADQAADVFGRLLAASRALLITRGADEQEPAAVFAAFAKHFVDTGLVDGSFRGLLDRARACGPAGRDALRGEAAGARGLLDRVKLLYGTLDANLVFHPPEGLAAAGAPVVTAPPPAGAVVEMDLRGVACPMNFVKAKMKMETMETGQALAIVLDDGEPIQNVPASFRAEGQTVESVADLGDGHWKAVIRKNR